MAGCVMCSASARSHTHTSASNSTNRILIRDASNFEGLNEHFFRIATQTPEENDKLVESIKKWTYMY